MRSESRNVSIVILTHNNLEYTRQCVESLDRTTSGHQILIIDNASTDATPQYLQALEEERRHVGVFLNRSNAGFAAGCNQGVAAAKHGTVCLLNNDTVAFDGWLERMLEVLDTGVGIVGSKLLLPEGTMQHCGIVFDERRSPVHHFWPYHRYLHYPPEIEEANRLEEVPAVTGACLLTTKKVWDRVGGMDEGYKVANFEDVDFNLAVRSAGFRVMYQPASVLTHHWGTTVKSKRSDPDSPSVHMQHNFERLMSKWYGRLKSGMATVGPHRRVV